MAAILCNGIGSCCKGLGQCLSLPCQLCGNVCGETCRFLGQALSSPFTPYLLTTLVLNLPPTIWGLKAAAAAAAQNGGATLARCHGDTWLWVNSILALSHILAAFYIVNRIQQEKKDTLIQATVDGQVEEQTVETGKTTTTGSYQNMKEDSAAAAAAAPSKGTGDSLLSSLAGAMFSNKNKTTSSNDDLGQYGGVHHVVYEDGDANTMQRLKHVLCYDLVVAIYIVLAVIWCIWQSMGITQIVFPDDEGNGGSDLCNDIGNW
eukprot:CAMPEP_0168721388 /NCGR_PEP_ID=MMETSP0724-20121128/2057_1 /TAXON_ID=265536 /ORGANISM="Amphiprora sp., Strain CCMP467" /LENGTH=261 /DNA_ID=CAMNT_0008768029 /DNA_START=61 /DNA_END=843 /DNA_ORIENTATION=-